MSEDLNKTNSINYERRWVLVFAILVMFVTSIPYLLGYAMQNEDWRFTGFVLSVEDGNAFIGKMLSGTVGEWLFRTPYTTFSQSGFLIFLPYILLGKLVSVPGTHEQLVALYHIFRIGAGVLVIVATYDFISFFIINVNFRRFGLVLATLGGGLGWLLVLLNVQDWLGSLPLEFYSPESFGFLSLYVYPHYTLARALLLWGFVLYLQSSTRLNETSSIMVDGIKVGVVWLLTGLAQPLTGMVACIVVGIYIFTLTLWQLWLHIKHERPQWLKLWNVVKLTLWAGLLPAPFILYNLISSRLDPFLKMWTEQSYFGSPHPAHYLLAFGLIFPFALVGGKHMWCSTDWTAKLPVAWVIFFPILAYAPIGIQRRLPEGIWVAWVVLAMLALELNDSYKIRRACAVLLFAFPSTILLLVGGAVLTLDPAEPLYRPSEEVDAFKYIATQSNRNVGILASYNTGNAMPAWAPVFVVVGHGPESVGLAELFPRVEAFYSMDTLDSERIQLLSELDVDYIFWGPNERALGEWDPNMATFLSLIYHNENYEIFKVEL